MAASRTPRPVPPLSPGLLWHHEIAQRCGTSVGSFLNIVRRARPGVDWPLEARRWQKIRPVSLSPSPASADNVSCRIGESRLTCVHIGSMYWFQLKGSCLMWGGRCAGAAAWPVDCVWSLRALIARPTGSATTGSEHPRAAALVHMLRGLTPGTRLIPAPSIPHPHNPPGQTNSEWPTLGSPIIRECWKNQRVSMQYMLSPLAPAGDAGRNGSQHLDIFELLVLARGSRRTWIFRTTCHDDQFCN